MYVLNLAPAPLQHEVSSTKKTYTLYFSLLVSGIKRFCDMLRTFFVGAINRGGYLNFSANARTSNGEGCKVFGKAPPNIQAVSTHVGVCRRLS